MIRSSDPTLQAIADKLASADIIPGYPDIGAWFSGAIDTDQVEESAAEGSDDKIADFKAAISGSSAASSSPR